jgi:hypothetical protein
MPIIMPYGVAIQQAVAGGDVNEMRRLEKETEAHLSQYGDVRSALAVLKTEIAKRDIARAPMPLYAVAMQQAVAVGDLAEMRRLEKEAEAYLTQHGDMQSALTQLRGEIARAERKS